MMVETNYIAGDRRPIASRERKTWQALARYLARQGISPNRISIMGMMCGLVAGLCLATTSISASGTRGLWLAAAGLVQLRLLANMLDGMVAIQLGKASRIGELYNEIPDRVSDAAILIGAGYAAGGDAILGFVAAIAAVFVAYVRAMGKAAGGPCEFCGPMAKPQRMFTMTIVCLYQAAVPQTWHLSWGPNLRWGLAAAGLWVVIVGGGVTAIRRLTRIAAALRGRAL